MRKSYWMIELRLHPESVNPILARRNDARFVAPFMGPTTFPPSEESAEEALYDKLDAHGEDDEHEEAHYPGTLHLARESSADLTAGY